MYEMNLLPETGISRMNVRVNDGIIGLEYRLITTVHDVIIGASYTAWYTPALWLFLWCHMHRQTAADAELTLPTAIQASLRQQTYQNSTWVFRTIENGWQLFYRDPPPI